MSSVNGQDGQDDHKLRSDSGGPRCTVETMLFESLVHQLLEKGILTRNDALSIVQTVAHVKLGRRDEPGDLNGTDPEATLLRRLYSSFEAVSDRSAVATGDDTNVLQLRPPLHGDAPEFPRE